MLANEICDKRKLKSLLINLNMGDWWFNRKVYPSGDANLAELVEAIKNDPEIISIFVNRGRIMVTRGRDEVELASYETHEQSGIPGGVNAITAYYDDETSEQLSV